MTVVTLWLLISVGGVNDGSTSNLIARFADSEECFKTMRGMRNAKQYKAPDLVCIQTKVVL